MTLPYGFLDMKRFVFIINGQYRGGDPKGQILLVVLVLNKTSLVCLLLWSIGCVGFSPPFVSNFTFIKIRNYAWRKSRIPLGSADNENTKLFENVDLEKI